MSKWLKETEEKKSTLLKNDASSQSTLFKDDASSQSTLFKGAGGDSGAAGDGATDNSLAKKPNNNKTAIIFSLLSTFLGLLIISLALLMIFKPELGGEDPKFDVWEGEDVFGNAAHLVYPLVTEDNVTKMDVYKDGEKYSFIQFWDENLGKYDWRIEGLEAIDLNMTTFEMLRMWLCTVTTKDPIRNVSEDDLKTYGVDKEKENGFTVYFTENGVEKSHTVRIGEKTDLSSGVYYAYYEGRNHIYKISPDIVTHTSYGDLKYLSPAINTFFEGATQALMGIERFDIYLTDGTNTKLNDVVSIRVNEKGETSVEFKAVYGADALGRRRTTIASTSYVNTVFTTLYTAFAGSEVVAINPTDSELEAFGLSDSQEKYFINVEFSENATFASSAYKTKEPSLFISRKIDGVYYVMSEYYGVKSVVRVEEESLSFLGESAFLLLKWTDTNSVKTGFFETLTQTEAAPGLEKIFVWTPKSEDIFTLSYDVSIDELTVYAENANLVFKDDNTQGNSFNRNKFRNLYIYMLYFPFIYSFNEMSDEATLEYIKEENLVYSITAQRNDETVIRHSYYSISATLAVERVEEGKIKNGEVVFGEPSYGSIVEKEQIRRVTNAIDKLLAGEELLPDEDILK